MKKEIIIICAIALFTAGSASAAITVYPDDRPGWESAVGVYEEEFFTDAALNPGVSVVSEYPGYVDTIKEVWWDRLVCPYWGLTTTIWQFDTPLIGYGGNWNPGVPGGPGAHIEVAINESWVSVGEIPNTYTGQFWGFISTEPFDAVRLSPGSYCYPLGGAWCETYELDNMVYSYFIGRIFPDEAAELAKEVIQGDYLWGGKGFNFGEMKFASSSVIKEGYWYWNEELTTTTVGKGLDCSGLSLWSYNRAYYGDEKVNWVRCAHEHECPLGWERANEQCVYNIEDTVGKKKCPPKELNKGELRPGDLLFFDAEIRKGGKFVKYGQDGVVDHVAMYVPFSYEGKDYEVIHAHNKTPKAGITATSTVEGLIEYYKKLAGPEAFVRSGHVTEARKPEVKATATSSVDLIVTDPTGIVITKEDRETIGMSYYEYDIDGDGELDDIVNIAIREIGDYLITVVPEPDALPTDTYTLEIEALVNGEIVTTVLAEDVQISEIPRAPYIIQSTETEIIPIIPTFIDFNPDTLNLKSKGKWVTTYIELPLGYDINEIDLESIKLNGVRIEAEPTEIGDYDDNSIPDLMVKFDRSAVQAILEVGEEVQITISGKLIDERPFKGGDIIRVISQEK